MNWEHSIELVKAYSRKENHKGGSIVKASKASLRSKSGQTIYAASKSALDAS